MTRRRPLELRLTRAKVSFRFPLDESFRTKVRMHDWPERLSDVRC